ncbi:MAG: GNAT family N-acetyltransferase [Candidatus Pacebacteria bacterium]|nr:GNAT family N-acetyltransferase [Candidatus Paceibacterota bacterium]
MAVPTEVTILNSIHEVKPDEWGQISGCVDGQTNSSQNPFISHKFLSALEDSAAVGGNSGWYPRPMILRERQNGGLIGAALVYLKAHSMGEYVFDHGWAQACEGLGQDYYPKLQLSVPFSPVPGPRVMVHCKYRNSPEGEQIGMTLAEALIEVAQQNQLSSIHATFVDEYTQRILQAAGFLPRHGIQFHWQNKSYVDFDGFLAELSSRKRKAIRRERQEAAESGIEFVTLSGDQITEQDWDGYDRCYRAISDRKWGTPYLPRGFFTEIGRTMGEQIVLVLAKVGGEVVAGALNLRNQERLFGRNWGSLQEFKFIHFETCYYRAIDYAIAEGLQWVEAGVQGEHKLQRGYLPVKTVSLHWLRDERLRAAVADFLRRESLFIDQQMAEYSSHSPYRQVGE